MFGLAGLYHAQGRNQDAEPLYAEVLERRRRSQGAEHPQVISLEEELAAIVAD